MAVDVAGAKTGGTRQTSVGDGKPNRPAGPANDPAPVPKNNEAAPTPTPNDTTSLSPEAVESPEPDSPRAETLSAALQTNFGSFDADENGHITDSEVARALEGDGLTSDERAALTALRDRQGIVEEAFDDEYFDENDGFTPRDIEAFENGTTLDARRTIEEFNRERAALEADPNHRAAPLELGDPTLLNRVVDAGGTIVEPFGSRSRTAMLRAIDAGLIEVDPASRLGAYEATGGFREGTVGHAAHAAIGTIFSLLGTGGEERIGEVFNSPEARALYEQPVDGPASLELAQMEYDYWASLGQDGFSPGGFLGRQFGPETRDWLQRDFFR